MTTWRRSARSHFKSHVAAVSAAIIAVECFISRGAHILIAIVALHSKHSTRAVLYRATRLNINPVSLSVSLSLDMIRVRFPKLEGQATHSLHSNGLLGPFQSRNRGKIGLLPIVLLALVRLNVCICDSILFRFQGFRL